MRLFLVAYFLFLTAPVLADETVMTIIGSNDILELSKGDLQKAEATSDNKNKVFTVFFKLTEKGSLKFAKYTQRHINKKIDINVCGKVISSPVIREPIYSGTGALGKIKSKKEAAQLAINLNTGKCN